MMMIDYLNGFMSNFAGAIALVLYIAGVLVLLHSMRIQDRQRNGQAAIIAQLRKHLGQSVKAQVELHDHVTLLNERYTELLNRQQRVETRAPDSRRIDTAMRMLKRGNGDAQTLQDLGLSYGEVKLLLRLHGKTTGTAPTPSQQRAVSPAVNASVKNPRTNDVPATKPHSQRQHPVAAQGRALAQMLQA